MANNKVKVNKDFYGFDKIGKVLYLSGFPTRIVRSTNHNKVLAFKAEPLNKATPSTLMTKELLTEKEQQDFYIQYQNLNPTGGLGNFIVFNSYPTDTPSMEAICALVRNWCINFNFSDFEVVHFTEKVPFDTEAQRDLYVVTGVNGNDPNCISEVRRWVSFPKHSLVILHLTCQAPYLWCTDYLGVVPDALFSVRQAAITAL